jgi:uncharacterized coiled-coil protein SlyX
MRAIGINLKSPYDHLEHIPGWSEHHIARILKSSKYAGILYQDVYENVSYKVRKKRKRPMEEWVPINVPVIIEKEKWDLVQAQISKRRKSAEDIAGISMYDRTERKTKYGGLLKCGDCGRALTYNEIHWYKDVGRRGDRYHPNNDKVKMIKHQYTCITYRQKSSKACSNHNITIEELDELVLEYLRKLSKAALDVDYLVKELETKQKKETKLDYLSSRIAAKEKRVKGIEKLLVSLYEDFRINKLINEAEYIGMKESYTTEKDNLQQELETLNKEKAMNGKLTCSINWREQILRYKNIKEVTRPFLLNLVDYIEVFQDKRVIFHLKIGNPFLGLDEYLSDLQQQDLEPIVMHHLTTAQAAVRARTASGE